MDCVDTHQLNAYTDAELPSDLTDQVSRHLTQCPTCAAAAAELRHLTQYLDTMPKFPVPARLARRTRQAFRAGVERPGFIDWWRGLGVSMRSAACAIALAGLVSGIMLAVSLSMPEAASQTYIATLYHTEGILP